MAVGALVTKLPWKQLILMLPDIAKTAKDIWNQWDSKPKPKPIDTNTPFTDQIYSISDRIEALEINEANQSKVVADIAEQLQGIAIGLKQTASRQVFIIYLCIGTSII